MPHLIQLCLLGTILLALATVRVSAQEPTPVVPTGAIRVFFDCEPCDENYLRTEITFIDYVRDRADANLHVLVSTQPTGRSRRTRSRWR